MEAKLAFNQCHVESCWWCGTSTPADSRGYYLCSAACDSNYMATYNSGSYQQQVPYCCSCYSRSVVAGTAFCSKRCSWFACSRCPQCGRNRDVNYTYCSQACASHALQANWCPSCGLRQIIPGLSHCGTTTCVDIAGAAVAALRRPVALGREPSGFSHRKEGFRTQQVWLPMEDKVRANIVSQVLPHCRSIVGVAKLAADSVRKKRYLGYRSCVEQQMFANKAPKYGHGGEGNEHRRFLPISFTCQHLVEQAFSSVEQVTCCDDKHCSACSIVAYGFSKQLLGTSEHFSTSSAGRCLSFCTPFLNSPSGNTAAMVVARTVVGVPNIVPSLRAMQYDFNVDLMGSLESVLDSVASGCSTAEQSPGQLSPAGQPLQPPQFSKLPGGGLASHSTICIQEDGSDDMLVDSDDAVDALFLVIVEL